MIRSPKGFLIICFTCLLPFWALAEAPVVDDSENFVILDEGQAAMEQPVAKAQLNDNEPEEEIALAQDNEMGQVGGNVELLDKLKGLQQELQELRGQLEVQAHELKSLQQQQLSFYKDIDARIRTTTSSPSSANKILQTEPTADLSIGEPAPITNKDANSKPTKSSFYTEGQPKANQAPTSSVGSATRNPADEQISYLAAYDLVKNKHFDEALSAMQNFVAKYPQGGYTANAHYWLGELYMVKKNYSNAIGHFQTVLNRFPSSSKTAACLLKIGYALAASGQEVEARQHLQEVVKNYPDTPTAELAAAKLKSISML
ncbi:outer membrane protein [Legionella beliardensis]|uniref:Cell division coordinator CpoB n=1 Tax=Legionella beliardensis TaxID=91822 RepID=A0A378I3Q9_9GAMM|nr:tol-pal system protein YbgF [Legionella beliardensis]STX29808.1 outer membrane protein [Legionella beliardensis]